MNMAQYATIMPEYDLICFNLPHCPFRKHGCILVNVYWFLYMPESTRINFSDCQILNDISQGFEYALSIKCAMILNIPQYNYNKIIIDIITCLLDLYIHKNNER